MKLIKPRMISLVECVNRGILPPCVPFTKIAAFKSL